MMKHHWKQGVVGLGLGAMLAGCVSFVSAPIVPSQPAGLLARCGADRLIGLIGQSITTLPAQPADRSVRVLRPGDPVTEDFNDQRLNVILDGRDIITAISCG